ncbi:hypothetical protein SRHO_G00214910 [Serrasalmus rhombeus]
MIGPAGGASKKAARIHPSALFPISNNLPGPAPRTPHAAFKHWPVGAPGALERSMWLSAKEAHEALEKSKGFLASLSGADQAGFSWVGQFPCTSRGRSWSLHTCPIWPQLWLSAYGSANGQPAAPSGQKQHPLMNPAPPSCSDTQHLLKLRRLRFVLARGAGGHAAGRPSGTFQENLALIKMFISSKGTDVSELCLEECSELAATQAEQEAVTVVHFGRVSSGPSPLPTALGLKRLNALSSEPRPPKAAKKAVLAQQAPPTQLLQSPRASAMVKAITEHRRLRNRRGTDYSEQVMTDLSASEAARRRTEHRGTSQSERSELTYFN